MNKVKKGKLSILMGSYNLSEYIVDALDALVAQDYHNFEIIVIDDCSIDDSLSILKDYTEKCKLLHVSKNDRNRGVNSVMSKAFDLSTGEFIFLLSMSDHVYPGFFRKSIDVMNKNPGVGLCCSLPAFFNNDYNEWYVSEHFKPPSIKTMFLTPSMVEKTILDGNDFLTGHTSIFRREVFETIWPDARMLEWHSDWFLIHSVAARTGVLFIPEVLSGFRVGSKDDVSYSDKGYIWETQSAVINSLLETLKMDKYSDVFRFFINSGALTHLPGIIGVPGALAVSIVKPKYWGFINIIILRKSAKSFIIFFLVKIKHKIEGIVKERFSFLK